MLMIGRRSRCVERVAQSLECVTVMGAIRARRGTASRVKFEIRFRVPCFINIPQLCGHLYMENERCVIYREDESAETFEWSYDQ